MPEYKAIAVNEKTGAFIPKPNVAKDGFEKFKTEQEALEAATAYATDMNEKLDVDDWKGFFEMCLEEEPVASDAEDLPESMQQALDNDINP